MTNFYVSNYHSKKALSKAVSEGRKISVKPIPLTRDQQKQNLLADATNTERPFPELQPTPNTPFEIQGSFNKQVPFYVTTVILDDNLHIAKVI